jgi:hypothetical protein
LDSKIGFPVVHRVHVLVVNVFAVALTNTTIALKRRASLIATRAALNLLRLTVVVTVFLGVISLGH